MTPEELVAAHQAGMAALRDRLTALLTAQWAALGGQYNDAALERWVTSVVPVALAAQRHAALLTDAYLARLAGEVVGGVQRPVGVDAQATTGAALRNGVDPATVYGRPIVTVRTALAAGTRGDRALERGLARAHTIAQTDVQLAQRAATLQVIGKDSRIVGYRRVLRGGPKTCGLCVMAATQRYHVGDLMPIHGNCRCAVAPIYGEKDIARVINGPHLAAVNDVMANWDERRFGPKPTNQRAALKRLRFDVRDHGETGPTLVRHGDHWTGPEDIAA